MALPLNLQKQGLNVIKSAKILIFICAALFMGPVSGKTADTINIFAASSLKTALDKAVSSYPVKTVTVNVSYGASSTLARQIEQGAPADIFISADEDWMDYTQAKQLIVQGTRSNFVGNRLVLVAPKTAGFSNVMLTSEALRAALGNGRLVTGDVNTVPVGKYAKQALSNLGLWEAVQTQIAGTDNARSALNFVALGEAGLGIVYESDARAERKVKVVAEFPQNSHKPIIYPVALLQNSKDNANGFKNYLLSPEGFSFFTESGFYPVVPK